jgi:hypothetical protein
MYVLELRPHDAGDETEARNRITYAWCGENNEIAHFNEIICAAALGAMALNTEQDDQYDALSLIASLPRQEIGYSGPSRLFERILADIEPNLDRRQRDCIEAAHSMTSADLLAEVALTEKGPDFLLDNTQCMTTEGFYAHFTDDGLRPWVYDLEELGKVYGHESVPYKKALAHDLGHFVYTHRRRKVRDALRDGEAEWLEDVSQHPTLGRVESGIFIPVASIPGVLSEPEVRYWTDESRA